MYGLFSSKKRKHPILAEARHFDAGEAFASLLHLSGHVQHIFHDPLGHSRDTFNCGSHFGHVYLKND